MKSEVSVQLHVRHSSVNEKSAFVNISENTRIQNPFFKKKKEIQLT